MRPSPWRAFCIAFRKNSGRVLVFSMVLWEMRQLLWSWSVIPERRCWNDHSRRGSRYHILVTRVGMGHVGIFPSTNPALWMAFLTDLGLLPTHGFHGQGPINLAVGFEVVLVCNHVNHFRGDWHMLRFVGSGGKKKNTTTVLLANALNLTKINIISSAEGSYGECRWGGVTSMIKMTPRRSEMLWHWPQISLHRFNFIYCNCF